MMKPSREVQRQTKFQPTFQNSQTDIDQAAESNIQVIGKHKVNLIRVQGIGEIGSKQLSKFNTTHQN